ncbi:MAG: S1 family peptidase [Gammaproteobacteria bacterium]
MLPRALIALVIGAWACIPAAVHASPLADIVARVSEASVSVGTYQATRSPPVVFRGTGFAVVDGLHVITNDHVLPDKIDHQNREILAVFAGEGRNPEMRKARTLVRDPVHDVALLQIEGTPLPIYPIGDDRSVRPGEEIAFTGFPIGMVLGLHPVTHRGIVSAITPVVDPAHNSAQLTQRMLSRMRDPFKVFQLDATAYPGNSGSPVYRQSDGKVIGVVNSVFVKETKETVIQKPSGITYAIPIRHAVKLLRKAGVLK